MIGNLGGTRRLKTASQGTKGQFLISKEKADNLITTLKSMPEVCFEHIEQQVHRERRNKDEERLWTWFVEQKMQDLQVEDPPPQPQQQQQQNEAQTVKELSDLTHHEETTRQLILFPERNALAGMAANVDIIIEQKENCESCTERGDGEEKAEDEVGEEEEEEEEMIEISDAKVLKESAVKKCHSDPAMGMRRRGYARQLLRAVHTGKRKEAWRGRTRTHEPAGEKYEGGDGGRKEDESGGWQVRGKSGRQSGSEMGGELEVGQSTLETCHRIPLERPTVQKIEAMQQRILSLLDQILYRLSRISVPDGENDRQRRQRRSMEFAVRFSRNYLYDLNRLVTRLRRNLEAIERLKVRYGQYPIARGGGSSIIDIDLIERELVAAHQLLLHALTAYSNHIPGAAFISHTARLTQVLLKQVVDLKQVSEKCQLSDRCAGSGDTNILHPGESDKEFRSKCQAILTRFDEQWTIQGPKGGQASQAAVPLVSDSVNNRTTWNRGCCTNRLKMYNGAELAIAKSSRKQQHRPPGIYRSRGNKRENLLKNKSKCIPASTVISKLQRSGRNVANAPVAKISYTINQTSSATHRSASADEEPKKPEFATMMTTTLVSTDSERAGSTATEPGLPPSKKKGGTVVQVDQTIRHGPWKDSALTTTTNASVSTDASSDNSPRSFANCGTTLHRLRKSSKNARRFRRTFTSNGGCDTAPTPVTKGEQRIVRDASCQANSQSDSGKVANYLPPVVNESRTMLMLSERTEKCFSEYRWYYQQQCRLRPMYSNSARNKPWDIVSWISDKLVDELLHHVSKELQITSVIRKMFELEFRDS